MTSLMHKQPVINIGTIGHVARGKSSLVKSVSGIATQKHTKELARNITMRVGYANAKIYKCEECTEPECYQSDKSESTEHKCKFCNKLCTLVNHISFVDCPGHNSLMAVMLTGAAVMDCTILIESVDTDDIPAPQTREHLISTQYAGIPNAFVCLNKIDLVTKDKTKKKVVDLNEFLKSTPAKNSPIIPISATHEINIDVVCELLAKITPPIRDVTSALKMLAIRSFNINKPKTLIEDLKGGVIGGTIVKGTLNLNDKIIIYPGYIYKKNDMTNNSLWQYKPIECTVESIQSEKNSLDSVISGGLIAAQLDIDPALASDDKLSGQVILLKKDDNNSEGEYRGSKNVYEAIEIEYNEIEEFKTLFVIELNTTITLNINSSDVKGKVDYLKKKIMRIELEKPVYIEKGDRITISHIDRSTMEILGMGKFIRGVNPEIIKS